MPKMSLMRSPKQYRAFMNNPNQKPPAVFPQSLSGSETDISTSNENLSNEEKYVIRHTERQEPQGEENLQSSSNRNSLRDSLPSNRSSLDVSSSSYNTLIIHSIGDESWTGRNSGPKDESQYSNLAALKECPSPSAQSSKDSYFDAGQSPSHTQGEAGVQLTEIPADYLNQSTVLKHLAKEVKPEMRAPPEYSTYMKSRLPTVVMRKKNVRSVPLSKSQPDLRKLDKIDRMQRDNSVPRPKTNGREESIEKENMWTLEFLIKENHELKMELEKCYMRVSKSQKLEEEVLKIHRSHEELVQSCDRRERLERAARARLQSDCQRLQELNRTLKDQIGLLSNDGLRREVNKRELLITQLITQNKEFQAAKDRQEIELTAQRATLQEQRTHIDILEAALTNAQGNVVRLEEENRKKQVYVERVVQLQRALSSLQLASDRREQTERQLRQQLENELERTKNGQVDVSKLGWEHHSPSSTNAENAELKKRLRDREEKIMRLEGECSKWEQRYLEESALRQAAIDAASIPKDAKIAALEKTSQETEKIIAEARNEKIRHMDEAHAAQKKVADLESRLKDLESKLAERDAMIRVLQKHTYDKDVSSMLSRSPHHTPHQSIGSSELDHVLGTTSRDDLVSSVLTSSTSFGSGNSYAGSDSSFMQSYKYESKSFDSTKQTLDNQIKEIDNQLDSHMLSKDSLIQSLRRERANYPNHYWRV
ncbi:angiomotin-like protein 1 isoform X2 [Atheta coriaria]|uniref:angiomotin-like protein 1 isoform X2 n=1 Tax=Dalotia coriaria TaxID=877792 RepID=UPI0031F3FBDE